jgi:SAM-dependent methyltransferase
LLCRNASISDFVSSSETDEVFGFLGGERRRVDREDFSDCIAMSPFQQRSEPRAIQHLQPKRRQGNHPVMDPAEYALMDAAEASMWWYRALHAHLSGALADVHGRVLDAGCGTGGFLAALRVSRPDLLRVGIEWDGDAAARARWKSGAAVVRGKVGALPFADDSFDAAVAADVLCHAAVDPPATLLELKRVLRPGGRLIVNMPAYKWLLSAHDRRVRNVRRLTAPQTAALLRRAGFRRAHARYWNGLLLPLMVVQRKILARGDAASDVAPFPPWLDAMLHAMTELERRLPFPLPAGGSVLAVAENP